MSGFNGFGGKYLSIPPLPEDLSAMIAKYIAERAGATSRQALYQIPANSGIYIDGNGALVRIEQWSIYPLVPGSSGTVDIFHGQSSATGLPTCRVTFPSTFQFRPVISPSGGGWWVQNNTAVVVVASLAYHSQI